MMCSFFPGAMQCCVTLQSPQRSKAGLNLTDLQFLVFIIANVQVWLAILKKLDVAHSLVVLKSYFNSEELKFKEPHPI